MKAERKLRWMARRRAQIGAEKIFDAMMTATPRIIDEVVRNILTG